MNITTGQLRAATGATQGNAERWLPHIASACALYAINTPARMAAFLAQIGHESGRLRYSREIWGPTAAQSRYEGRKDLGNVRAGDGKRYMGRGLIQTTGRANYAATTQGLRAIAPGVPDFEAAPELLELPEWAALSAAWYWDSRGLNDLADQQSESAFVALTRRINGGTNGLSDRLALWDEARRAFASVPAPLPTPDTPAAPTTPLPAPAIPAPSAGLAHWLRLLIEFLTRKRN